MNELKPVIEIMQRHGFAGTPEEFHSAVNVTFHKYESAVYDQLHHNMWNSLPQQFSLLADDCLRKRPGLPAELRVLDIGSGTGLASDCLLRTELGKRVRSIDLLDTSPAMLARAKARSANWNIPVTCTEGIVESVPGEDRFDLIITCSVLHHVPNLAAFLEAVRRLQKSKGIFLHLQDPNGDALSDPELKARTAEASQNSMPEWVQRLAPARVLGRLYREVTGQQGNDYISKTNKELLERGVLKSPLAVTELFAITDIHVYDDQGISIERIRDLLPAYELLSQRSYGFFGELWSTLPKNLKQKEEQLIAANALNGGHIAAVWGLRS
jgi:SAM-dependent methyltransferase